MYPNNYIKPNLFNSIKNIGWSGILDGTQKTLGVINQAIPIVYQVKPIISNVKSMFRIANAVNQPDRTNNLTQPSSSSTTKTYSNNPVFYL